MQATMNVSFQDFSPNLPDKERYERGVDYLWHDFDLEFEDAFHLIKPLKNNRSSVIIYSPSAAVDFYIFDGMLCVQIDGDGFWHETNIDLKIAKEILKATYESCADFGTQIPGTNQQWEAYCV
jgi:hypothetical protein